MSALVWVAVGLVVWVLVGLAVGLVLGPVLRRNTARYPLVEDGPS